MEHMPLPLNRLYLAHQLSEPAFGASADDIFYVKQADGRRSIIRQSLANGLAHTVTAEPLPVGSVGYGGAMFAVQGDVLVYAGKGGQLVGVDLSTGEQWMVTPAYDGVAAPAFSPCGRYVAFLAELDARCNVLVSAVRGSALPVKLSDDPWYAFNPAFAPDGARVAWMEWDELAMPWDESRIVVARLAVPAAGARGAFDLLPISTRTLSRPGTSYASPQFSPLADKAGANGSPSPSVAAGDDGPSCRLAFTSDESGWRSLWVGDADGAGAMRIDTGEGEIGGPDWVPGQIKMRWGCGGRMLYAVRRHRSRDTLLGIELAEPVSGSRIEELAQPWTHIVGLEVRHDQVARIAQEIPSDPSSESQASAEKDRLVFVGSDPATPASIVTLDPAQPIPVRRATGAVGMVDPATLSAPEVLSWPTAGGESAWGILYKAVGPQAAEDGQPGPLIVQIHGGPTSEVPITWNAQAQYFATRGWHYLEVNYRGSTGYGRAYQERLNGNWGVCDVEDAKSGAEALIAHGLADATRLVITGGSAGGYTTMMALTQDPEFWTAGVALYGIGDMYDLKEGAHRFEVNYEAGSLLGRLPATGPLWKDRSPLTHVQAVRAPVLLFHGVDDKAVPVQQSVDFEAAVRRQGGRVELVTYEGEGHGFVKEATRRDVIERMERFLDKFVLCRQA